MGSSSYLVSGHQMQGGVPGPLQAFTAGPDQIVNIGRNIWARGVLAPCAGERAFRGDGPGRGLG